MSHRYRMPDRWKEQEATKLKKRFAAYSRQTQKPKKSALGIAMAIGLALIAYALWRYRN